MDLPRSHPSGSHWTWSQLFPSFLVFLQLCTITSFVNAAPQNITLDDTSPRITYAPADAWLPGQNCGTPGFDCRVNRLENFGSNGTWHYGYYSSTNNTGALSAELTFNGTAVSVFGVIARGATYIQQVLNFVVDGNTMGVYRMEGLENPGDAGYGLPFFHSPNLTDGEHKLRVETQGGATESLIMLDRFVYTPEALVTSAPPSPSSTSSAPTSSASAAATDSRGTISRPVVGGIAAAVAVLVLLLVALAFFLYRRRSRRPGAHREAVLEDDERTYPGGPTLVQPYSVPSTTGSSTHLTTSGPAMTEKTRANSASRPERRPSTMKGSALSPSSETSGSGSSSTSPGTSTTQNLDSIPVEAMMMNLAARGVPVPGDATPPAYATL
ncbi:hypothetical protein DL96DRAFT_1627084 [Flagelloscypha sp. PMI_526]|nr:hypothetical protein DL96DRAFT_1627084 [Flagelloscypha sp. PMI_526]